jgi:hypothetical protein
MIDQEDREVVVERPAAAVPVHGREQRVDRGLRRLVAHPEQLRAECVVAERNTAGVARLRQAVGVQQHSAAGQRRPSLVRGRVRPMETEPARGEEQLLERAVVIGEQRRRVAGRGDLEPAVRLSTGERKLLPT